MEFMELAEAGKVGTLIVKDHSRLGRNRLVVGQLLEEEFDRMGVRYIAIMDNIDSAKGLSDFLPVQDWFNEMHAKNTSQKVRAVFRSKGESGVPLSTTPPYGYLKNPEDKAKWIVDEEAAEVVCNQIRPDRRRIGILRGLRNQVARSFGGNRSQPLHASRQWSDWRL